MKKIFYSKEKIGLFTLLELLVVLAILGILTSILLPSLTAAREKAKLGVCMSNQKQIAVMAQLYSKDHNSFLSRACMDTTRPSAGVNGKFWYHGLARYGGYESLIYRGANGNDNQPLYHHSRQKRFNNDWGADEVSPPDFLVCPSAKVQKKLGYGWSVRGWGSEDLSLAEMRYQRFGRYYGMIHTVGTRAIEPNPAYRILTGDNVAADSLSPNDNAKYVFFDTMKLGWMGAYRHGKSLSKKAIVTAMEDGHVEFLGYNQNFLSTAGKLKYSYGYE